jgi:hypothetical protein
MPFDPVTTGPSVSQRQADMFQHASHDADYAALRKVPQDVAKAYHDADCREKLHGKSPGCPCPKCDEGSSYTPPSAA